jgi:uncharacterized protein (TIGR03067 family)
MHRRVSMILAAALLISAAPPPRPSEKADLAALQGVWVLKTTEYLGEKADQGPTESVIEEALAYRRALPEEREIVRDRLKRYRTTLEFKGATFVCRFWFTPLDGGEGGWVRAIKGSYTLDVSRHPRVMARLPPRKRRDGGKAPCSYLGLYSLQGDTLKLCVNVEDQTKLPQKLATGDDEDVVLLTFRRERR